VKESQRSVHDANHTIGIKWGRREMNIRRKKNWTIIAIVAVLVIMTGVIPVSAAAPTFSNILPSSGPTAGGTPVTITGTDFVEGGSLGVTIGDAPATSVAFVDPTHITAVTPAGTAGAKDVVVISGDGQIASGGAGAFTYNAGPTFGTISPTSGPLAGGTPVTITGSNFVAGPSLGVTIGSVAASSVVRVDSTHITAVTPAGTAGAKDVVVISGDGQIASGGAGAFTYNAGPTFGTISPTSGPLAGGTPVTITGSNFVAGPSLGVTIGSVAASSVVRVDSTHITAVTPAGTAGAKDVVVISGDGQTAAGTGAFTYVAAPVAAFSGSPTSGPKPLNVQFTDSSTGIVDTYAWNFGDGNTATAKNPSNLYTTAGSYTVILTVTGPSGSNTKTEPNYITVTNATTNIGVYKDGVWYLDYNGNGGKDTSADKAYSFGAPGWINVTGDWNNDGKTDIGVTNGQQWYLDWNGNGAWDSGTDKAYSFGAPGWTPVVGDWTDTGSSYIGVTNGQQWYLDWNGNGAWDSGTDKAYSFGAPGWTPIVGDWTDTGSSYIGVTNGQQWYLDWNGNGAWDSGTDKAYSFGAPGWTPVVGDWSATGASYIGVTNGQQWYLDWNGNGAWDGADKAYSFGAPEWTPVLGDWNGDGKSKVGIYKSGIWYLDFNGDGVYSEGVATAYSFLGVAGWKPVVGDWNGNGITKIGVFKNGVWYLDNNGNAIWDAGSDKELTFGLTNPDYVPVVGDWNGDKKTEVGFYRMGSWSLDYSGQGTITPYTFWEEGDIYRVPVVGDWNGDGTTEIGVFRNSNGVFNVDYNGNGVWDSGSDRILNYDAVYWTPVTGDWNGDVRSKTGVFKDGVWRLDYDGNYLWNATVDKSYNFGLTGSTPVTGDWNGDGKSKIGVYKDGTWYLDYNGNGIWDTGIDKEYSFGAIGWIPVVGKWT
jgi:PKD repeat protein